MTAAQIRSQPPAPSIGVTDEPVVACHECGTVSRLNQAVWNSRQVCGGCGGFLRRPRIRSIEYSLALTFSAAVLFFVANIFPFLSMSIEGLGETMYLIGASRSLFLTGQPEIAVVVFMATIVLPTVQILASFYALAALHFRRRLPKLALVFRIVGAVGPWAMLDVFLLAILVSYVKLLDLAQMELGEGFFAYIGALLFILAAQANLDRFQVWNAIQPQIRLSAVAHIDPSRIWSCHDCHQLIAAPEPDAKGHPHCPRCGSSLHHRKSDSVRRSWAFLIAAAAFYVPANVLPVSVIVSLGNQQSDTILSGVVALIAAGMMPIALLLFFASILIPVVKIICLVTLLLSVQFKSRWRPRERTKLFRAVELVGRWSMVDIFVISILAALVSLGSLATIEPGPGALAFCSVVILTMLAAESFDPRLIWDPIKQDDTERYGRGT